MYNEIMSTRIKKLRETTGLSQSTFAKEYGIPVRSLQEWEQGRKNPPDYVLRLLEDAVENKHLLKYYIMFATIPVLKLVYQGGKLIDSTKLTEKEMLLPIRGTINEYKVYQFMKSRCYEDGRVDLPKILAAANLENNDPWAWVEKTHGAVYEDSWWVKQECEDVTWEQVKVRL